MKFGITSKIILLATVLVFGTAVVVGLVVYTGSNNLLVEQEVDNLGDQLHLEGLRLKTSVEVLHQDVIFLSKVPPIQGIIRTRGAGGVDPRDGSSERQWRQRLATIFTEFLHAKPRYLQIRYIGVADNGREIVRLDRIADTVSQVTGSALQSKAGRPYFRDTIRLLPGQVYISDVDLNRENGRVVEPHTAVIRAAVPVYSNDGALFGLIVINMDFTPYLSHQKIDQQAKHSTYITNDRGDYLAHPDTTMTFAFDFGQRQRIQENYPQLTPLFGKGNLVQEMLIRTTAESGDEVIMFYKVTFDPLNPERFFGQAIKASYQDVVAEAISVRNRSIVLIALLIVVGIILALLFSRVLTRPLLQLTRAAQKVASGEFDVSLPVNVGSEIGVLGRAFQTMLQEMVTRGEALRESEARSRGIVNEAADGIVSIDETGGIQMFSPAAQRMFGYVAGEVIGQNVKLLLPEPERHRHDGYLRRYQETGEAHFIGAGPRELVAQRRDGSTFPIELAINEVRLDDQRYFYVGIMRDISKRKQAEAKIQGLARFVMNNPGMVLKVSEDYGILFANPASQALLGKLHLKQGDQVPERWQATIDAAFESRGVQQFEEITDDTANLLTITYIDDTSVNIYGVDITKRRQAKEELRASEERFALVARGTRDGLWDWDLTSGEIYLSPRWKVMLGYREDEIENNFHALQGLIHEDDLGIALNAWVSCMEGEADVFSVEYRLRDKQGDYRWIHSRGLSVRNHDDEPVRMAGSHTDITERKRMQEELQKSSTRQRYLMDNSPAIIYSAMPSGDFKITFVSENVTRLLGYKPAEMLADPNFWHDHIHPDDMDLLFSGLFTLFSDMEQTHDYRFRHKDGHYCWIHDTLRVLCNDEGEPVEVLGSLLDISERKQMEAKLHMEKAEQKVLIKKLQETQNQLLQSEKMASIGQLAAGVAHEINNPVGYIGSNISSLKKYLADIFQLITAYENAEANITDPATLEALEQLKEQLDIDYLKQDLRDLLAESEEGVERVKQIVRDLKDFSHVDEAEWQWADLHKGLDSTLNVVNNELKYKAEVIKEYGELPAVECLASQLNQVFMNLLVNAAHAIEERGVINIRTGVEDEWVWVEVADTGRGIDAESLKRIFDPFFTTKPVGTGTGLGLSLSYGIVNKHGGRIDVDSEPGKGTTFRLWLPIKQEPETSNDLQNSDDVDNTEQSAIKSAHRAN